MQNFSSIGKRIHARKKNWPFFFKPSFGMYHRFCDWRILIGIQDFGVELRNLPAQEGMKRDKNWRLQREAAFLINQAQFSRVIFKQ